MLLRTRLLIHIGHYKDMIDKVIYVESPLQFMSSFDYIRSNKNIVILYRKSQPGLEKTISFSIFSKYYISNNLNFLFKVIIKAFFFKKT